MHPSQYDTRPTDPHPRASDSASRSRRSAYTPSLNPYARRPHEEHALEASSNSETSLESRSMDSNHSDYHRGSRGGNRGDKQGNRAYSGTSASSNGPHTPSRPTLKPSPSIQDRTATSAPAGRQSPRIDVPISPGAKQQSTFTLNGNTINETYKERRSSPKAQSQPGPVTNTSRGRGNRSLNTRGGQRVPPRPIMMGGEQHWAYQQENKIRVSGIPKNCWTKEVHDAFSPYGNIVRIGIQPGYDNNSAYVIFEPRLINSLPTQGIRVGMAFVEWQSEGSLIATVPSPINPRKRYYEYNAMPAQSISFGIDIADKSMLTMHTVQSYRGIQVTLNLTRKELDVQFPLKIDNTVRKFKFKLPIALLSNIYKVFDQATGQPTLIIPFGNPPQFFVQKNEGEILPDGRKHTSFSKKENFWTDWNTLFRETDVVDGRSRQCLQNLPLMEHKDTAIVDIGRWTTYRLFFDHRTLVGPKWEEFRSGLADHGIAIYDVENYPICKRFVSPLREILQDELAGTHPHLKPSSQESGFNDLFAGQMHLSFQVRYQLEACLSNGYIKEHNITATFLEKLAAMDTLRAVSILEKVVDKQHTYYNPMDIFDIQLKNSLERKVPSYCVLLRSVIITPTMMHVASPVMETSNRIIRKHAADADRFIRVKFSDEKTEGPLRNMPNDRAEAVFDRVRRAMKHGIVVAGRYYEFLAFGNSQFREHGAYFYAPTSSKSADDIRLSLGQFDHIKTVAKFGARLGQCFSTTRAIGVDVNIREIPDIIRNGYNFTDGVGKLSLFVAQMAAQELGLSNAFDDPPSLYQFRLGGCKGVLALDLNLNGLDVHIRPSQHKFKAESKRLEIIRSSALATPFFNRQIIMVLSSLGVPDSIFIKKQQEMVTEYELAMTDEHIALQKLRNHIDMNQTTITIAGMILDGFMETREPFIMSLLRLWRACTIKNLKEKARIAIEDGAFVLGCVDETATLHGHMNDARSKDRDERLTTLPEIFLQVDDTSRKGHYKIVEGVCILARNPSLHPGDIRVVRAIDVPALRHLRNVVVLPQTGDRDLANMCSGGDLDGDDYMVLWDAELIPQNINEPPMDFTAEQPVESDKPITVTDISEFFVTYMKNDSLGQIAHAHLAQADINHEGVQSATCLALAKLHSQAVDYPKSGIPAIMDRDLKPAKWPHFMEKRHLAERKIYRSNKILGMLYDRVQLVDFKPQWDNAFDQRILGALEPDEKLLAKAGEIKTAYDESLRRLMAKHGIRTEFEAWSVFVLQHNHESRDYKFAEEFGRTLGAMKAQYKNLCRTAAGATDSADWTRIGPFVAAMYTVTAREMEDALKECRTMKIVGGQKTPKRPQDPENMPLLSFPWLFPSELGKIATGSSISQKVVQSRSYVEVFQETNTNVLTRSNSGPEPESQGATTVPTIQLGGRPEDTLVTVLLPPKPPPALHTDEPSSVVDLYNGGRIATQAVAAGPTGPVQENYTGTNRESAETRRSNGDEKQQQGTKLEIKLDHSTPTILERLSRLN